MGKLITRCLLLLLICSLGCSKDVLKQYDKRIIGTWRIADVNRVGIGGSWDNVPFRSGFFSFREDGSLTYINPAGERFQGSWDITKKFRQNDDVERSLQITVVNFGTQDIQMTYFDDMNFWGTDYFKATTVAGLQTYVTHFRR
jgi:hypothetical protein